MRSFDDPRIRFENLTVRGPYPTRSGAVLARGGDRPGNECLRLARGQWIAHNSDDDAFTPDHVEVLLAEARARRLELVFGKIRRLDPQGGDIIIGTFAPDAPGQFGVQAMLFHRGLRPFPHDLLVFDQPGDWVWLRRMMRIGVRMGMIDDIVVDYYPSQLWGTPARPAGLLGRERISLGRTPVGRKESVVRQAPGPGQLEVAVDVVHSLAEPLLEERRRREPLLELEQRATALAET